MAKRGAPLVAEVARLPPDDAEGNKNTMNIEENRPKHVILYSISVWHISRGHSTKDAIPQAVTIPQLRDNFGPCQFYPKSTVENVIRSLEDNELISKVTINGKTIGYEITSSGCKSLEDLGKPKQWQSN